MAVERNPFLDDVSLLAPGESLGVGGGGLGSGGEDDGVHRVALERLLEEVPEPGGQGPGQGAGTGTGAVARVVLLLAPRAGFGKTHLLNRVAAELGGRAVVVPLAFSPDSPVVWDNVAEQVLVAFERPEPGPGEAGTEGGAGGSALRGLRGAQGGEGGRRMTRLDGFVRWLWGELVSGLIERGAVRCGEPAGAVAALRARPADVFDFSVPGSVGPKWLGDNLAAILPAAASELARRAGVTEGRAEHWLRALTAYAEGVGDPGARRSEALRWAVSAAAVSSFEAPGGMEIASAAPAGTGGAKDRVVELCRVASLRRPVVFFIDHLDAFYEDTRAGLAVAYFISELQQQVRRELTVLSLNEDVWESTFRSGLPSAFEDRLTANVVNLGGVGAAEAARLVRGRLEAAGADAATVDGFARFLRLEEYLAGQAGRLVSPRVVLRYAAVHWDVFARGGVAPPAGAGEPAAGGVTLAEPPTQAAPGPGAGAPEAGAAPGGAPERDPLKDAPRVATATLPIFQAAKARIAAEEAEEAAEVARGGKGGRGSGAGAGSGSETEEIDPDASIGGDFARGDDEEGDGWEADAVLGQDTRNMIAEAADELADPSVDESPPAPEREPDGNRQGAAGDGGAAAGAGSAGAARRDGEELTTDKREEEPREENGEATAGGRDAPARKEPDGGLSGLAPAHARTQRVVLPPPRRQGAGSGEAHRGPMPLAEPAAAESGGGGAGAGSEGAGEVGKPASEGRLLGEPPAERPARAAAVETPPAGGADTPQAVDTNRAPEPAQPPAPAAPERAAEAATARDEGSADAGAGGRDDATPFSRLKDMLSRLRQERAEVAGREAGPAAGRQHEGSATTAEPEPGGGRAPAAAPEAEATSASPDNRGAAAPISAPKAPAPRPGDPDQALLSAFAEARADWEGSLGEGEIDLAVVRALVELAGKRFPAVRFETLSLPGPEGGLGGWELPRWAFGGNEVIFGLEPQGNSAFWKAFEDFALRRHQLRIAGTNTWVKPVALRAVADAGADGAGDGGEGAGDSGGGAPAAAGGIDVIELDRSAVAALYAADALVRRAQDGEIDADPGRVLSVLASQLDFFWKRLTRPPARVAGAA